MSEFPCIDIAANPAGVGRLGEEVSDETVQVPLGMLDVLSPVQLVASAVSVEWRVIMA